MKTLYSFRFHKKYHYIRHLVSLIFMIYGHVLYAQEPVLTVPRLTGKPQFVTSISQNKYVFVYNIDLISLWDAQRGLLYKNISPGASKIVESPDKRTVALMRHPYIRFFDIASLKVTDSMRLDRVTDIAYTPDGTLYATINYNNERKLVSINPYTKEIKDIWSNSEVKSGKVRLAINSKGNLAILQPEKSQKFILQLPEGKILKTFETEVGTAYGGFEKNDLMFTPDDKILEVYYPHTFEPKEFRVINPITFNTEYTITINRKYFSIYSMLWVSKDKLMLCHYDSTFVLNLNSRVIDQIIVLKDGKNTSTRTFAEAVRDNGALKTVYKLLDYPIIKLEEWNIERKYKIRTFGTALITPMYISVAPNAYRIQLENIREVTLNKYPEQISITSQNRFSAYSPDGKYRYHFGNAPILSKHLSGDKNGKSIAWLHDGFNTILDGLTLNQKGNTACIVTSIGTYIVDVEQMKIIRFLSVGDETAAFKTQHLGCFIENETKFVAVGNFKYEGLKTYCFNVSTGAILWKISGLHTHFKNTPEGILCYSENEQRIKLLNSKDGSTLKYYRMGGSLNNNAAHIFNFSPDGKKAIYSESNKLYILDIANEKRVEVARNESTSYYWSMEYFPVNPKFAICVNEDGRLQIIDTEKAVVIATLFFFGDSEDWIFTTPDGYFDASPNGIKYLYYVKGNEFIPLESIYEKYYTPGLIMQLFNGLAPTPNKNEDDIKKIKWPPTVKIIYQGKQRNLVVEDDLIPSYVVTQNPISILVEATAPDDIVEDIRLYQNGKLIAGKIRGLVVEDEGKSTEQRTFTIELVPGQNSIKAVAINSQRTESAPAEILVEYQVSQSITTNTQSQITLYAVVIGINKYKNPKYNLNYAVADASAVKEQLQQAGKSLFNDIKISFITDENATKDQIVQSFQSIKSTIQPKDVFMLYYAGHGVIDGNKQFYLVPHDVTQLYGNDEALQSRGISASYLQQCSQEIKAQKQLFILDACQSARAIDVALRGAAEEKAIAQLARSTGTHWLTASGSEQFASEFAQLGHGTFTYALIEALDGKADNGDKKITVKELDAYLQNVVPELTAKYKGTPQYPASYGFGNDFPIGLIK